MRREKAWAADEKKLLARVWISTSEDPVVATDQMRKLFIDTVCGRFIDMAPMKVSGRYVERTEASIMQHFQYLSADVNNFRSALRTIIASSPTGVNDNKIQNMAVALHLGKAFKMQYTFKDFNRFEWHSFKACLVMRKHPKWAGLPTGTNMELMSRDRSAKKTMKRRGFEYQPINLKYNRLGNRKKKSVARYLVGVRKANSAKEEQLKTQAVRYMAESTKQKSDCLEKCNAIAFSSRPEAEGLEEMKQFFQYMRALHFALIAKRATFRRPDNQQSSNYRIHQLFYPIKGYNPFTTP